MNAVRTGFRQSISLRNRAVPRTSQSIQLLQMSHLELVDAITQELVENPLLEAEEDFSDTENVTELESDSIVDADWSEDDFENHVKETLEAELPDPTNTDVGAYEQLDPNESIEGEIEWDDRTEHVEPKPTGSEHDKSEFLENQSIQQDLNGHLLEQLQLADCTEKEARIASIVFEYLNEDGYISLSTAELLAEIQPMQQCGANELEDVLALVQQFSPLGVCARDLRESLLIQTRARSGLEEIVPDVMKVLLNHFDLLAEQRLDSLRCEFDGERLAEIVQFIGQLNPRPAASFAVERVEYVEPEARVRKHAGEWRVEMLDDQIPNLRISDWYKHYRSSLGGRQSRTKQDCSTPKDREFLQQHYSRAKLFLSSVRFRSQNVLKIVMEIVKYQQDFFDHGDTHMKPLVLADIASEIGLHTSTVSRLTSRKYIDTPHGIFELKHFFTNRVGTQPGKEHSSVAIRSVLKQLIQSENPVKPLSDQRIVHLLKEKNIEISRRTVTKYREALSIPASKERRRSA